MSYMLEEEEEAEAEAEIQFLLLISIIKLILLKIRVKTVKFQIYEWQRATVSGADETRHWQWCVSKK
jgi:hypothetical protein